MMLDSIIFQRFLLCVHTNILDLWNLSYDYFVSYIS